MLGVMPPDPDLTWWHGFAGGIQASADAPDLDQYPDRACPEDWMESA
jgi:hypothetical protein